MLVLAQGLVQKTALCLFTSGIQSLIYDSIPIVFCILVIHRKSFSYVRIPLSRNKSHFISAQTTILFSSPIYPLKFYVISTKDLLSSISNSSQVFWKHRSLQTTFVFSSNNTPITVQSHINSYRYFKQSIRNCPTDKYETVSFQPHSEH